VENERQAQVLTTADFFNVGENGEGVLVAERDVDEAVVGEGGHGRDDGALLSTTRRAGGHEYTRKLAVEGARRPEAAGSIPERLSMCAQSAHTRSAEALTIKGAPSTGRGSCHNAWGYRRSRHRNW